MGTVAAGSSEREKCRIILEVALPPHGLALVRRRHVAHPFFLWQRILCILSYGISLPGHKKPYPKPEPELTETEPELSKTSVFGLVLAVTEIISGCSVVAAGRPNCPKRPAILPQRTDYLNVSLDSPP
jgi:hypothetical protein